MKKLADFLVKRRYVILPVFLALALLSAFFMGKIHVNYDMTEYLPEDSAMSQGMKLMEQEFGAVGTGTLRLMFRGLEEAEKLEIRDFLASLPNVGSAVWEADSPAYNRDEYTLYVITMPFDSRSDECTALFDAVKARYADDYEMYTGGTINDANVPVLSPFIIALAFILLTIVLFIMSNSWFEPVIFLADIAVAILINLGTNALLPSVSETTHSIAAVLQLALSMDYSIILMNRYTQEKERAADNPSAMKNAVANSFSAIAGSSLTTFVGLLALVFMRFRIGADLGIVLAKSVLISLICIFTVLPALILMSDKITVRLRKKALHIPMGGYAELTRRFRHVFPALFFLLFIGFSLLKGNTRISYSLAANNEVDKIFQPSNSIVLLYRTEDSEAVAGIAADLEKNGKIVSVTGYYNTLGVKYTADALAQAISGMGAGLSLDASALRLIYYDYHAGQPHGKIPLSGLLAFLRTMAENGQLLGMLDENTAAQLDSLARFTDPAVISAPMGAPELAAAFGLDSGIVSQLMQLSGAETMSMKAFADFMASVLAQPEYAAMLDLSAAQQLAAAQQLMGMAGAELSAAEFARAFGAMSAQLDENTSQLLYLCYYAQNSSDPSWTMTLPELLGHISDNLMNDRRFSAWLGGGAAESIAAAKQQLTEGAAQLQGEHYGRLILDTAFPEDSDETRAFLEELSARLRRDLTGESYLIGNSVMGYEMSISFRGEMNKITAITAAAIFLVVAVTFRSLIIPLILVLVVQCGVFATMTIIGAGGGGMYYLALLIVQCILMGATIDYGILFTTYYKSCRQTMDIREAIRSAYDGSMHTILTSSLIVITVTGILGFVFSNPAIGEICLTIAKGAFCATVLIVFILPGVLAYADQWICGKKNGAKERKS